MNKIIVSFSITPDINEKLKEISKKTHLAKSDILRRILDEYFDIKIKK